MKKLVFPLLLVLFTCSLRAQTKVFKEISEDLSTQFKPITGLSADGLFTDKDFFVKYASAFKDFKGNTIFAGTALTGKSY